MIYINIPAVLNEARTIADDNSHGYDQGSRLGPDYDCSSYVARCLRAGGSQIAANSWTGNMRSQLLLEGWTSVTPIGSSLLAGDVLLNDQNHVALVYQTKTASQPALLAQATINELGTVTGGQTGDQTGTEIGRNFPYYNYPWDIQLRPPTAASAWISGNRYLTQAEMENNALLVAEQMVSYGWTINAVAGMLGNMQTESGINPGIWESLIVDPQRGFGLVQWTPSTNYTTWAAQQGYADDDGVGQLAWINGMTVPSGQWIPTTGYPMSFADYMTSDLGPDYLAKAWMKNFERPGTDTEALRAQQALAWYQFLMDHPWVRPFPVWLLFKFKRR